MIDEKLYRETFSRLRASDEAKEEVLLKMNEMKEKKSMKRPLKALRALAMAAVLTLALAVTANAASNGTLFDNLRIIWQDGSHIVLEDDNGARVEVIGAYVNAELQDGKLMLTVDDATAIDITEQIVKNGSYTATVNRGGEEVNITVTGSLEDWDITTSCEDGNISYTMDSEGEIMSSVSYPTYTTTTVVTSSGD